MQRGHQRVGRRQRFDIDQPARGFDQQFHPGGAIACCGRLGNPAADFRNVSHRLRLGNHESVKPLDTAEAGDLRLNGRTVDRVQPDRDGLLSPVMRGQCRRRRRQCCGFFARWHRVFKIQEYRVGGGRRRILHVPGAMRGHRKIAAGQSRRRHDPVFSNRPSSARIASVCSPTAGISPITGLTPGMVIAGRKLISGPFGDPTFCTRSLA